MFYIIFWKEFDNFFFDNLQIADKYGFITTLNNEAIGMISWDPRKNFNILPLTFIYLHFERIWFNLAY